MKRKLTVIVPLLLLLVVLYLCAPLRGGYLGPVSVSVLDCVTNASGQVTARVAIANGGSHILNFAVGTQLLLPPGWVDSVSRSSNHFNLALDSDPLLAHGSTRIVSVPLPAPTSPWRAYVICQKHYPDHWSKTLRWVFDAHILKRGVVEPFYSPPFSSTRRVPSH